MVDLYRFLVITVHAGHAVEQLPLAGSAKQVWRGAETPEAVATEMEGGEIGRCVYVGR